jgi:coenzyme F420 hydrogenase subunit beta
MKTNVQNLVVNNALCCGCGACSIACSSKSIEMSKNAGGYIVPIANDLTCIDCELCVKVCPSLNNDFATSVEDPFYGDILAAFVGYACDEEIRNKSQSGGIVTGLLLYLLDEKLIDTALVNRFNAEMQINKVAKANNINDLIAGCGSYYCQSTVVSDSIQKAKDDEYAVVCLGCQSSAFENIKKKVQILNLPKIKIGLFCTGNYSTDYMNAIQERITGIKNKRLFDFHFKNKSKGNWPGNITFLTENGEIEAKPYSRILLKPAYSCFRCQFCHDQLNIESDVSVGDPWGLQNSLGITPKEGYSVVIARTANGLRLLNEARIKNYIKLEEISSKLIMEGQTIDKRAKNNYLVNYSIGEISKYFLPPKLNLKNKGHKLKTNMKKKTKYLQKLKELNLSKSETKISLLRGEINHSTIFQIFLSNVLIQPKKLLKRILKYFIK